MIILLVGSGGREHAIARAIKNSPLTSKLFITPGNPGMQKLGECKNIPVDDIEGLCNLAKLIEANLVIIGPEVPLVKGLKNKLNNIGIKAFGPTAEAAMLEGSKTFSRNFCKKYNIPQPTFNYFTDIELALDEVEKLNGYCVVKADGLAAGKGVTIAHTIEEAKDAIVKSLESEIFGEAGKKIVIEEFLEGEEASFIVITDGKTAIPFASSQDHKARDDGDQGPNTGGMGAYSPAPIVNENIHKRIMDDVIYPTINGLKKLGYPYCGFLYAGMMISKNNEIKVLEFNCRFGDPETQPIMMRLKSDLADICNKACEGKLENQTLDWDSRKAVGIVMAAKGYPNDYKKGGKIKNLPIEHDGFKVFHAGTEYVDGDIRSNGGRVLCITSLGDSVQSAQKKAYSKLSSIKWDDSFYREDIGYRAIEREKNEFS